MGHDIYAAGHGGAKLLVSLAALEQLRRASGGRVEAPSASAHALGHVAHPYGPSREQQERQGADAVEQLPQPQPVSALEIRVGQRALLGREQIEPRLRRALDVKARHRLGRVGNVQARRQVADDRRIRRCIRSAGQRKDKAGGEQEHRSHGNRGD